MIIIILIIQLPWREGYTTMMKPCMLEATWRKQVPSAHITYNYNSQSVTAVGVLTFQSYDMCSHYSQSVIAVITSHSSLSMGSCITWAWLFGILRLWGVLGLYIVNFSSSRWYLCLWKVTIMQLLDTVMVIVLKFKLVMRTLSCHELTVVLGPVHTGSQVLSPKSHEVNLCDLNHWEHGSWDLPLHMGSQVLSLSYDMDAYMATLFGGEAWDLCCELGWAKT